ncbi:MAG: ComEA family DNA-binding protein [Gemmatimonadota bacterium]
MTRDEARALAFIAFLLTLSGGIRLVTGPGDAALLAEDVDLQALETESGEALEDGRARSRPLADGETLDPNRATAAQLDRLPGIGPQTADRIVATRDTAPFATPGDLLRVRGVGPATLEKIRPFIDLGFVRPPATDRGLARAVDVNRAAPAELETLPGIGPALAGRIIAHRDSAGPFRSLEELLAVRGIGPATLERMRGRVLVR